MNRLPGTAFIAILLLLSSIFILSTARVASAQTELGQFRPGLGGLLRGAILPPPGILLSSAWVTYRAYQFVDSGGAELDITRTIVANRNLALYTAPFDIFGGNYAVLGVIPFMNFAEPDAIGLSDIYIQPITFGWHLPPFHVMTGYGFYAPTGSFTYGSPNNTGFGFWSHLISGGFTYLQMHDRPWHFTAHLRYEIPMEIKGTNIVPGQVVIYELGLGKQVSKRVDLGVVAAGAFQTSNISGSDFAGDPRRYYSFSAGPAIQVTAVDRKKWNMLVLTRTYFEALVRNSPQGVAAIVSVYFHIK